MRISDPDLPPDSPITPLSHDDDSCEEDDAVAPTTLSLLPDSPVSNPAPSFAIPHPVSRGALTLSACLTRAGRFRGTEICESKVYRIVAPLSKQHWENP